MAVIADYWVYGQVKGESAAQVTLIVCVVWKKAERAGNANENREPLNQMVKMPS